MDGMMLIEAERRRQVTGEGFDQALDDTRAPGAFLAASHAYRLGDPSVWPWDLTWWKPKDHKADLVRAGALALAGADRAARLVQAATSADDPVYRDHAEAITLVGVIAREIDGLSPTTP